LGAGRCNALCAMIQAGLKRHNAATPPLTLA